MQLVDAGINSIASSLGGILSGSTGSLGVASDIQSGIQGNNRFNNTAKLPEEGFS